MSRAKSCVKRNEADGERATVGKREEGRDDVARRGRAGAEHGITLGLIRKRACEITWGDIKRHQPFEHWLNQQFLCWICVFSRVNKFGS